MFPKFKGGPGSGRKPGSGHPGNIYVNPSRNAQNTGPKIVRTEPDKKPKEPVYQEQPASRNPGKPRSGVSPADLFPNRHANNDIRHTTNEPDPKKKPKSKA